MIVDLSAAPYAAGELAGAAIAATSAGLVWRHRQRPAAIPLAMTQWACAWWAFWHALSLLAATLPLKTGLADLWWMGAGLVYAPQMVFSVEYYRQAHVPRRAAALACLPGVATVLAVWTNPLHHLLYVQTALVPGPPFTRFGVQLGPAAYAFFAAESCCLLIAEVLLVRVFVEQRGLLRRQAALVLVGLPIPWAASALFFTGHQFIPAYDITTLVLAIDLALIAWALYGQRLLDIVPVAYQRVIEGLSEAVVVLDGQGRVLYFNRSAEPFAARPAGTIVGQAAAAAFPDLMEAYSSPQRCAEIVRGVGKAQRIYDVRAAALPSGVNSESGWVLTARDETEHRRVDDLQRSRQQVIAAEENVRRQIAELLHGPIQNKLLAVWAQLGVCQASLSQTAPDAAAVLASLRIELDRVREGDIRRASHLLHPPALDISLLTAVDYLAGGFEDFFRVDVRTDPALQQVDGIGQHGISDAVRLVAYRAIEEALNNSAKHAQASRVEIELSLVDDHCVIVVRDDGPGFDLASVRPGFGLNSIGSRVEQCGGEWKLVSAPEQGTALSLMLPIHAAEALPGEATALHREKTVLPAVAQVPAVVLEGEAMNATPA